MILCVAVPTELGVYVAEQLLVVALTGVNVQLAPGLKVPDAAVDRFAVPAGGVGAPVSVSITAAVQVTPPPTTVGFGVQLTVVAVERRTGFTVWVNEGAALE